MLPYIKQIKTKKIEREEKIRFIFYTEFIKKNVNAKNILLNINGYHQ